MEEMQWLCPVVQVCASVYDYNPETWNASRVREVLYNVHAIMEEVRRKEPMEGSI